MLARFQPADTPGRQQGGDSARARHNLTVPFLQRPLSLAVVPDRAMQPELDPGQLVYVQNFEVRGLNYLEQRMAVRIGSRHEGRVLVRRIQHMFDGTIRLFGNRDGYEETFIPPDEWEQPSDWQTTGRLHPNLVALGPLVTASAGGRTYLPLIGIFFVLPHFLEVCS